MNVRNVTYRDNCSWREIKPPGRDGWGKDTEAKTKAMLAYLAAQKLATAREIHFGALLGSPTWRPRHTANRLLVLLARGKVKRRRCGIFEHVPGAAA